MSITLEQVKKSEEMQGLRYQDRHAEYPRAAYQRRTVSYTFRRARV